MAELPTVAPEFVDIAHRIVWAAVATVEPSGRPRSRVLHPMWEWDGERLVGWIATGPTPRKRADLAHTPFASVTYWDSTHDTATAECRAELLVDLETRRAVWERFASTPMPLGYDPAIIPGWDSPASDNFAVLRLDPWRLRAMRGTVMLKGEGAPLSWTAPSPRTG